MKKYHMSESFLLGVLLALAGGFLDAYTYVCRGKIFANAQTGNIVLLGIHLANFDFIQALHYLIPIIAFSLGIFLAENIRHTYFKQKFHWRQIILLIEMIIVFMTAWIDIDMIVNVMISFVCALQVESFRKFHDNAFASTMCTGNLRSATEHLYHAFLNHDKTSLKKSVLYFLIIAFFIIGAMICVLLTPHFNQKTILFSLVFFMVAFIKMFEKEKI